MSPNPEQYLAQRYSETIEGTNEWMNEQLENHLFSEEEHFLVSVSSKLVSRAPFSQMSRSPSVITRAR